MPRFPLVRAVALAAGIAALAGCEVGPRFESPKESVPAAWSEVAGAKTPAAPDRSVTVAEPTDVSRWWRVLRDPELSRLVERATRGNLDLKVATARIRQARAAVVVAGAGYWPTLSASGSAVRSGSGAGTPGAGGRNLFTAGLDAAWELDVFGGTRRGVEAARANLAASVEDRRDVLVSLAAEVATDYVVLRGAQQLVDITKRNLASQRATLAVTRQKNAVGLVSKLDVANAKAQVATTEAQIPTLETRERQSIHAISVLLGEAPGALLAELAKQGPVPASPPRVPVGLPSDLLVRRPDIRSVLDRLHAATAEVGVATADLYPRFSLTGALGLQSDALSTFLRTANRTWSLGGAVSWPIFQGDEIRGNIEVSKAIQEQTLLTYRSTILGALRAVEDALVAFAREQDRRESLVQAVASDEEALRLATDLYRGGATDYLNVLNAQRQLLASQSDLVTSRQAVATDLIALYKALGGGWSR